MACNLLNKNNFRSGYLGYLEKKEKKIIFSLKKLVISHGQLSAYLRVFKGLILGFALGNLLIQTSKQHSFFYYLSFFILSFLLAVFFINYEKRHYRRKGLVNSIRILFWILVLSFLFSSIVFVYGGYKEFIIVLTITMFFSSLSYSME